MKKEKVIELLPCPFCGGQAKINNWHAWCTSCFASTSNYETLKESAEAWNRRTPINEN